MGTYVITVRQTETNLQMLRLTQGYQMRNVEGRGINQELGMNIHTLLYIRQITDENLLYSTGNSTQYSVITYAREESKKEWKYICICITESLCRTQETGEGNGTHSSTLAWEIPWKEEPSRLQSMGLRRVGHNWATSLSLFTFMHLRRKWQITPVFLPGESQGRGSLVGCHLWGHTESATTDVT